MGVGGRTIFVRSGLLMCGNCPWSRERLTDVFHRFAQNPRDLSEWLLGLNFDIEDLYCGLGVETVLSVFLDLGRPRLIGVVSTLFVGGQMWFGPRWSSSIDADMNIGDLVTDNFVSKH